MVRQPAKMTTEDKFQAAVNIIRSLPKDGPYQPSHDMMLKFYGLYKQAVEGPCIEPKPAFYEVVKGYKWQAWQKLGSMTKSEAMNCYVEELKKIIETMAYTENVANFIDTLGPFYEYIDVPSKPAINNNTAKAPPSPGDLSDATENSGSSSPLPNGVHCMGAVDAGSPQSSPLPDMPCDTYPAVKEVVSQDDEEKNKGEDAEEREGIGDTERRDSLHEIPNASNTVFSDSDSDEEYSEPAEELAAKCTDQDGTRTPQPCPEEDSITHGGGDKAHPGGLQMTPKQSAPVYGAAGQIPAASPQPPRPFPYTSPAPWGAGGGGDGGGGGRGSRGGGSSLVEEDVSAQLIIVLRRLQSDMESVLHRLNTLEALSLSQHHSLCHQCQGSGGGGSSPGSTGSGVGRSWWPFPELSPRSTFFLLMWPILLHGGFRLLLLLRCRRRHNLQKH